MLLVKTKLNTIEVLISSDLIDLYICHDEFISIRNMSKEYDDIKEAIKNLRAATVHKYFNRFMKQCYHIV